MQSKCSPRACGAGRPLGRAGNSRCTRGVKRRTASAGRHGKQRYGALALRARTWRLAAGRIANGTALGAPRALLCSSTATWTASGADSGMYLQTCVLMRGRGIAQLRARIDHSCGADAWSQTPQVQCGSRLPQTAHPFVACRSVPRTSRWLRRRRRRARSPSIHPE